MVRRSCVERIRVEVLRAEEDYEPLGGGEQTGAFGFRNAAQLSGQRLVQWLAYRVGDRRTRRLQSNEDPPSVLDIALAPDESTLLQTIEEPGHRGLAYIDALGECTGRNRRVFVDSFEDFELGRRHTVLRLELAPVLGSASYHLPYGSGQLIRWIEGCRHSGPSEVVSVRLTKFS